MSDLETKKYLKKTINTEFFIKTFKNYGENFGVKTKLSNERTNMEFIKDKFTLEITKEFFILKIENEVYSIELPIKKSIYTKTTLISKKIYFDEKIIKKLSKDDIDFIQLMYEEWVENVRPIYLDEIEHPINVLKEDFKKEYIKSIALLIDKYSNNKIRNFKYIFKLAYSAGIELRFIETFIEEILGNNKSNVKDFLENAIFISDLMNYFIYFDLKPLPIKQLEKDFNLKISREIAEYINIINKKAISQKKSNERIIELLKNDKFATLNNLWEQENYFNHMNIKIIQKEMQKMSTFKVCFTRNNENYHYIFEGEEGEAFQYFKELDKESNSRIVFENNEEIDFNEVVLSKVDKVKEKELKNKYKYYKKYLSSKELKVDKVNFPKVDYTDITEELILGYKSIDKERLIDNGIWAFHGDRWIDIRLESFLSFVTGKDKKLSYKLVLKQADNTQTNEVIEIDKKLISNIEEKDSRTSDLSIKLALDTNYFGDFLKESNSNNYKEKVDLEFLLEIKIDFLDLGNNLTIGLPIHLKLLNPNVKRFNVTNYCAIDFGTNSTCIAIQKGGKIELVSLERPESFGAQAYENPTNLLIRNWEVFSKDWSNKESIIPLPLRFTDGKDMRESFSQGHTVRNGILHASNAELDAVLEQLKLVPYKQLTLDEKMGFKPIEKPINGIKEVNLVSGMENENEESLDPIAFYGYLLGRAVLAPANEMIITNYSITTPVKFEKEVTNSIIKSLEYGIKLAAPENMRNTIKVREGSKEPVAFIRAVIGKKEVTEKKFGLNSNFAVFDFGGGTLDFAFGSYRKAFEEEEDHDYMLDIKNTSGDDRGGAEYIINKLSYEIYQQNKDIMKEERIPFPVPYGEEIIELFPEELLKAKTKPAYFNLRKLNETISRLVFENKKDEIAISENMELQNEKGEIKSIELNIEISTMSLHLENIISRLVDNFDEQIKKVFGENAYKNLHIFRAGNASRSKILETIMNEKYKDSGIEIHFVEEASVHGVKPKTAVAMGELGFRTTEKIGMVLSHQLDVDSTPFEFRIGVEDINNESAFEEIVPIGSTSKEWIKLGRPNKEEKIINIHYTKSTDIKEINNSNVRIDRISLNDLNLEVGAIIWIRPKKANVIEYFLGKKQQPNIEETGIEFSLRRY